MPEIKYICLSDLHLGAPSALLTDVGATAGAGGTSAAALRDAFSAALVATLAAFYKRGPPAELPGIVLLGDIFDFSLGTPRSSIDAFDALLKSLAAAGAQEWLGPFIFLPGNHDHELWTITRFQHMAGATSADDRYQHTTPAFSDPSRQPKSALIDEVLRNNGFKGATTCYPNMGLVSADDKRVVVLHHGHFVEPMYRAMSTLTMLLGGTAEVSLAAETLERLNASWIDFVWSSDGDNGLLGAEIGLAHDAAMTGRDDIRFDHRLAQILAAKLTSSLPLPRTAKVRDWTELAAKAFVDSTVGSYSQMERFSYQQTLGADSLEGLKTYLSNTVFQQIADEKPLASLDNMTFVFGHTHKPFETRIVAPRYEAPPAIYNTGGWDMDTPMFGTRLGAAAVFIDADLNVASLRLCDVPQQDDEPPAGSAPSGVRVATADGPLAANPLVDLLDAAKTAAASQWDAFSAEAAKAYRAKQAYIVKRLVTDGSPGNIKRRAL